MGEWAVDLEQGIRGYWWERRVIRRVLRRFGPLSERRFDQIFGDERQVVQPDGNTVSFRKRPKVRFVCNAPSAIILGDVYAIGDWSRWLHLTQIMAMLGEVEMRDTNEVAKYALPGQVVSNG